VKTAKKFADIGFFHLILLAQACFLRNNQYERGSMPEAQEQTEMQNPTWSDAGTFFLSLHPNNSLSRTGFIILMSLIAGVSFMYGLYFFSLGAWPIFGFFGLDVLLVYIAFRFSFRAARRFETVEIGDDMVTITRIAPGGERRVERFNAYWARALISDGRLQLVNRGQSFEIGNFLGEEEKQEVGEVITAALHRYRSGEMFQSPRPSTSIIS
jgi:uncharacterized membrane protein